MDRDQEWAIRAFREEEERLRRQGITPELLRDLQRQMELAEMSGVRRPRSGGGQIEFRPATKESNPKLENEPTRAPLCKEGADTKENGTRSNESPEKPEQVGNRDQEAKGDSALLDGSGYTKRSAAMRYLGIQVRQLQNLVRGGALEATNGRGERQAISNESLLKYQRPLK